MHATLRLFRPAFAACALGLAGHALAQSGSSASPFMPATAPAAAAAGPNETLEFAGINVMGTKTLVNVYDKAAKKGRWIEVGGSDGPFTVLAFDARRDQIVVKTPEFQKTLTLRKSNGTAAQPAPVAVMPAAAGFAVANNGSLSFSNVPSAPPPQGVTEAAGAVPAPSPATTPVEAAPPKPETPAKPQSVARQEEEARMLVSDLLEIGMAQRRAYEEAQRKAASAPAATTPPATATPPGGG